MPHEIDPEFVALPTRAIAEAALEQAQQLGVEHADVRVERIRTADLALHDSRLETSHDADERGMSVRVVHEGTWGFAGGLVLDPDAARHLVDRAVAVAKVSKPVTSERIELAAEPGHGTQSWVSAYEVDPFTISESDRIELLADWSDRLLHPDVVRHVDAHIKQVRENKFYADLGGTETTQQRVRLQCQLSALWVDDSSGRFETMRTTAPPVGRGWEFLTGGYDWDAELAQLPEWLAEKSTAPSVEPGRYDLIVDPSNLWLTIHESIGHATELDRALGYEANYAGTSFATPDKLGSLQYGSGIMHITATARSSTDCRPSASTTKASKPRPGTSSATACWSATSWIAVPRRCAASTARTAARSPTHRCTTRFNEWRTSACSPSPTAHRRTSSSRASRTGCTWSATSRGPSTCSATTSSSPASASSGSRTAGRRPGARRRLPGHHHRLLGLDVRDRRAGDVRARRRLQLRQGPARSGRRGQSRLSGRAVQRCPDPQRRPGGIALEPHSSPAGARRAGADSPRRRTAASSSPTTTRRATCGGRTTRSRQTGRWTPSP